MNTVATLPPQLPGKKKNKKLITVLVIIGVYLFVAWGVLIGFLASFLFSSKSTILLEPDMPKTASYSDANLISTAAALQRRWDILGYGVPWTSFTAYDNKIIGRIPKKFSADFIDNTLEMGVVEFVDLGNIYLPPGTKIATDANNAGVIRAPGRVWHTLFTNEEVIEVNMTRQEQYKYDIDFSLTETGGAIFAEYTAENIGSYLAIVRDKVIVSCLSIDEAIPGGSALISDFTESEAKEIKSALETIPLQVPLKWRVITTKEHIQIITDFIRGIFHPTPTLLGS